MKVSLTRFLLGAWFLTAFGAPLGAMGQRAQVFEQGTEAGIWDHGSEFYLRMDLAEIAELKDQKFVWAGFQRQADGDYKGEIVCDSAGSERKFPARAKLLNSSRTGRYYLIEILNEKGETIKELFVKGTPHAGEGPEFEAFGSTPAK